MKPRFHQLLLFAAIGSLTLGTPLRAEAQGKQFSFGAVFGSGGTRIEVQASQGRWRNGADSYALSTGYRDGYAKGLDDGKDRRAFEPRRHRLYRDGDHGFNRDYYMSRYEYQEHFRRGFLSGYDAGYRDAQRRWRDRDDRYRRDRDDRYDRDGSVYLPRRW